MEENLIRKRKWFMAWQDHEEEAWLEEMSKQGLHFQKVNHFGAYTFEQGVPVDYAYRLDYQTTINDEEQYFQIFQDLGWQYIYTLNGWRYFRQEIKDGKIPEIFTDSETKIKKYERVKAYFLSVMPISLILMIVIVSPPEGDDWQWWFELCLNGSIILFILLTLGFTAAVYSAIEKRIKELRSL
jgi:hypothetical protein